MHTADWSSMRSLLQGAQTIIHCVVSKEVKEQRVLCKLLSQEAKSPQATDDQFSECLCQVSAQLVGLNIKKNKEGLYII